MMNEKISLDDVIWKCLDCENTSKNEELFRCCPRCHSGEIYAYDRSEEHVRRTCIISGRNVVQLIDRVEKLMERLEQLITMMKYTTS